MKLASTQIERFLNAPDPSIRLALLFGPDSGAVGERAMRLARAVAEDPNDPFRVSELDPQRLASQPERLVLEAQALCFGGGRRLVRIRDADDALAPAVAALLALEQCAGFVLVQAGELPASSKLRQLVERADRAVAIGCWPESERECAASVRAVLAEHGLRPEPEALELLVERLAGDLGLLRAELAKLALYLGPEARWVREADVCAVVEDVGGAAVEDLVLAALLGERERVERELQRLTDAAENAARILRVAATTLVRLLHLRAPIERGARLETVLEQARPPVHFRIRAKVARVLRAWPATALEQELAALVEAEIAAKSGSLPDRLLCRRAFSDLADRAAQMPVG